MACSGVSTVFSSEEQSLIDVMFLCDEWKSSKGGISTFNRELAINLARETTGIKIHCYVSGSDEQDREHAKQRGVNLITAQTVPGSPEPLDCLKVPPPELLHPHIVISHGRKLGTPACLIARTTRCKWIQFVHVFCEDLGKFKETTAAADTDTIAENEKKHKMEIALCKAADAVVAVGSRLQQKYDRCLPYLKVEMITPGIMEKFCIEHAGVLSRTSKKFNVFMFGRAKSEDLALKGYDIVANAIGVLGEEYELTFVGSPADDHEKVQDWFLQKTLIKQKQIFIRGYCTDQGELIEMFHQSDLVALPSRTEGFGLVCLEAISCGVPVLVSGESGVAEALQEVPGGNTVIVGSDDKDEWAQRIREVSRQSPEERQTNARQLRENYRKGYPWRKECEKFKGLIENVVKTANDGKLNINVDVDDLKSEEQNMQTGMLARESVRCQEVQQPRASTTAAASGSVSHPQTEDLHTLRMRTFLSIIQASFHTTNPQSIEECNQFMEYAKEMKVIIVGVYEGSLVIKVKCESLIILEELWRDYSSGHLGEVIQNCFVTERILRELNLAELRLKTQMDIEEYNACKIFFEKDALRGALSSEFHSTSSASESPQKKEQWGKSEQKTRIMKTAKLGGTSPLTVVPTTGHGRELEEPWGREGSLSPPHLSTTDLEEKLEEVFVDIKVAERMDEEEEYYSSTTDDDSDSCVSDSENGTDEDDHGEELPDRGDGEIQLEDEGADSDEEEEELENEEESLFDEIAASEKPTAEDSDENDPTPRMNIDMNMRRVRKFYDGPKVRPQYLNILTDFVDAEIFLIDGDSLLLELLCQNSLDWQHGGQFLHLTYLLERFLQYFKDKGGVFHVVFFEEMEIIWRSRPSMLLARQALILHLQHNTPFTIETSIASVWDKHWKEYIDRNIPAFLVLTDAENVPWKKTGGTKKLDAAVEFFFRCLLLHCLGQGLNCVFISGVQMTATKVTGYYNESTSKHRSFLRKHGEAVCNTWDWLMRYWRRQCTQENIAGRAVTDNQIDLQSEVEVALQSPPQGGCREVATILACVQVLLLLLHDDNISKDAMKIAEDKVKLFLLQSALLKKLPLKYRVHTVNSSLLDEFCKAKDGKVYPFYEIHTSLWQILRMIQSALRDAYKDDSTANVLDMTSVADLMDGRLIHTLFWLIMKQTSQGSKDLSLPQDVKRDVESAWEKVVALVNGSCHSDSLESRFFPFFDESSTSLLYEEGTSPDQDSSAKLKRLLYVGSALVNEYVGDIRSRINAMAGDETEDKVFPIGKEFDELYHWHSLKPLSDDFDRTKQAFKDKPPTDPEERKRYFRQKMLYVRYNRFYGNSLVGGIDDAKIITVKKEVPKKKKGKKKDGKMGEKAKRIIEQNEKKRKDEERQRDQEKWSNFLKDIDNNLKKDNFSTVLQLVDKYLADCKTPELHLQALMKKAQSCLGAWQQTRAANAGSNDMKYPVLLLESVQKMAEDFHSLLTDKDKKKLAGFMQKLGFDDIAATLYDLPEESERKAQQLSVHTTSARFQLDYMGHLLKRETRTDRDSRVDHFIPDTWQRELLDAVDNNESAVIVAPTSSGKTFASYYCMEKVLTQDNDGVVVYVSPTKALVNQVAATVYARFRRKNLPEGRAVYGVFTRDYRYNTLNSQILVTVPQCLEILFLSPRRQDWTKNIRYVIFDEVHCLGQEIGAEVWEHLLLLIRCPFLALSATIGNPDDLTRWLQAAQSFREQQDKQENGQMRESYRIRLVHFHERYSDLEKSVYLPSPSNGGFSEKSRKYEGTYDVKATGEFARLHPCAQLAAKQLKENSFPRDMDFTPRESLQLFDVMTMHWPDKESLQKLSPERYFEKNKFIDKSCARKYEKDLKKEFKSWADEKHFEKVEAVLQSLNSILLEKQASTEEEWTQLGMPSSGKIFIWKNFPKLVEQLKAQKKLPALIFSFDRKFCEELAFGLAEHFQKREEVIKRQNKGKDSKLAEKRVKKANKEFKRLRDEETESTNEERLDDQVRQQYEKDSSFLNDPLPACTVAFTHKIGDEDLQKIMHRIWYLRGYSLLKEALRRGISYHHAGLKNKIRGTVEILFREKYLQVVTATGTLALGIHMPCKTVVFAGDSPYLNSLQYRQMSGRAGRRGFDPVGNVVFFGVPSRKVQRLITANVPKIVGNFPINVSLVLRLLLMTSKGDDREDALTKALSLLSHPFISITHPEMESQIKKHFLFCVELLTRLGLVKQENGAPLQMAGLATHLHYHEPSNYVLVSFLQRGLFHKICQPEENGKFSDDVLRKMVLVLSHLFGRRSLHASFKRTVHLCPTSKVILDDLPNEFATALREYNRQVTDVFSQYLTAVAADLEKERGEENKLPLSGIEYPKQGSVGDDDKYDVIERLVSSSIPYSACSSFAALSGNSDLRLHSSSETAASYPESDESDVEVANENVTVELGNDEEDKEEERIDHLLEIVRQDVYTDINIVPILRLKNCNSVGTVQPLNAYALDFFKHGSVKAIQKENGIKAGEVFQILKDFLFTIMSISASVEEMCPEEEYDNVVAAFKQLVDEYRNKFRKQFDADI